MLAASCGAAVGAAAAALQHLSSAAFLLRHSSFTTAFLLRHSSMIGLDLGAFTGAAVVFFLFLFFFCGGVYCGIVYCSAPQLAMKRCN